MATLRREAHQDSRAVLPTRLEERREATHDMELFARGSETRVLLAGWNERSPVAACSAGFRDILAESPRQLQKWYAFRDERPRGRARDWLASEGYRLIP